MESIIDYLIVLVIIILILTIMIYLLGILEQLFTLIKLRTKDNNRDKSTIECKNEINGDTVKDTDSLDSNKYS